GQETSERRKKPFQLARGIGEPPHRSDNAHQQTTVLLDPAVCWAGSTNTQPFGSTSCLPGIGRAGLPDWLQKRCRTRRRPWQEDRRYSGQTIYLRATHPAIPSRSGRDSASAIPGASAIMRGSRISASTLFGFCPVVSHRRDTRILSRMSSFTWLRASSCL